ncbi:hypothetical protein ABK040_015210 [Willaertia magna]
MSECSKYNEGTPYSPFEFGKQTFHSKDHGKVVVTVSREAYTPGWSYNMTVKFTGLDFEHCFFAKTRTIEENDMAVETVNFINYNGNLLFTFSEALGGNTQRKESSFDEARELMKNLLFSLGFESDYCGLQNLVQKVAKEEVLNVFRQNTHVTAYKYTFLLNHKSNVKYFIFNQSTGYYDQERNLERFKLLFIEDLANLFKNNDCNKQQLLSFKYIQGITPSYGYFGYSPILNGERLAQIIIDFQKITSLQNLTVTSCWGEYLNKFADEMAKLCDKNIFNNLKKLKLNCGDTFDENSFYNFLEKLNETKVVIKSEDFTLVNYNVATAYKMLTKSNIYFSGNLKINYAHYNTEDYVQKFDIVKFLENLQRSYKLFSLKIADCDFYTTTNQLEKLFNFKNLTTFECINTTIKKYNDDGTETILTKEFFDSFKFQKLKLIKLEKLNLNEIPNSLNNLNLNQLSLANNKIENINNLNLQNNLFIDIQNNNIKDISILNKYRYINLLNNPILQNKNIGFYNNTYFLIDNKEILFKKYFQNNLMELYLFNYMQFVKVLKKKNSKNSKIPILSNSKAFLQLLNLSKFNDQLKDTFYETALNNLKLFKFYLNILYTEPEENPYSIKGIGAVVQVAIQNCENNNDWLIISLNCNLKNGEGFIVEEISVWNRCDITLEKINYILKNWKQMVIKK